METQEAGITGTRTVVATEAVAGEEKGVGEESIAGSNTGKTETGTGGTEVGNSQAIKATTRDTTPTTRDHIMIATDLY